jgi:4-diphosphocytidyl-2-C-methyl-D-erythritol kinase
MARLAMAAETIRTRAAAKVNLTLHVKGRRADGYHELESLVVFAGIHDVLCLEPGGAFDLAVTGPRAAGAGPLGENLVLKAARLLDLRRPLRRKGRFTLLKRLPAAAGIGGGSANAAAALRLLAAANDIPFDDKDVLDAACATGADVPVCIASHAQMMRGIGERLEPSLNIGRLFGILVNPGVAVETASAFRAFGLAPGEDRGLPDHPPAGPDIIPVIAALRNDFEPHAIGSQPVIGEVLETLRSLHGCRLARMSGSGATCFGLFGSCHEAAAGARALKRAHPDWWIESTVLR